MVSVPVSHQRIQTLEAEATSSCTLSLLQDRPVWVVDRVAWPVPSVSKKATVWMWSTLVKLNSWLVFRTGDRVDGSGDRRGASSRLLTTTSTLIVSDSSSGSVAVTTRLKEEFSSKSGRKPLARES